MATEKKYIICINDNSDFSPERRYFSLELMPFTIEELLELLNYDRQIKFDSQNPLHVRWKEFFCVHDVHRDSTSTFDTGCKMHCLCISPIKCVDCLKFGPSYHDSLVPYCEGCLQGCEIFPKNDCDVLPFNVSYQFDFDSDLWC